MFFTSNMQEYNYKLEITARSSLTDCFILSRRNDGRLERTSVDDNLSEMIKLWTKKCVYRAILVRDDRIIRSTHFSSRSSATWNSRLENVIARRERERIAESFECGNPREILETDVSANESIWRTSRRQGEAPYYTPHPPLPLPLHRCLHRLLFLLSPPGFSAFSAIAVVTTSCRLGRLSSRFCDPEFSSCKLHTLRLLHFLRGGWPWQMAAPLSLSFTRILTATGR